MTTAFLLLSEGMPFEGGEREAGALSSGGECEVDLCKEKQVDALSAEARRNRTWVTRRRRAVDSAIGDDDGCSHRWHYMPTT